MEIDDAAIHDFDAEFVDEGGEFGEEGEVGWQWIFVLEGCCDEVDHPLVDQQFCVFVGFVHEVLLVLLQQQQRLFVLILLSLHQLLQQP